LERRSHSFYFNRDRTPSKTPKAIALFLFQPPSHSAAIARSPLNPAIWVKRSAIALNIEFSYLIAHSCFIFKVLSLLARIKD
jgi:hypothetical protein